MENSSSVDKDGVTWTRTYANEDWTPLKKFERWLVLDGMRPT
jgi:hypothetical protein